MWILSSRTRRLLAEILVYLTRFPMKKVYERNGDDSAFHSSSYMYCRVLSRQTWCFPKAGPRTNVLFSGKNVKYGNFTDAMLAARLWSTRNLPKRCAHCSLQVYISVYRRMCQCVISKEKYRNDLRARAVCVLRPNMQHTSYESTIDLFWSWYL